jgi:hypothetical protein
MSFVLYVISLTTKLLKNKKIKQDSFVSIILRIQIQLDKEE